jgi:phospholipid transport system transporter-binding protein
MRLDGDAVIATIATHHRTVVSAFATAGPVTIDLSALGGIDASFVQLLCSAAQTAAAQKRPLALLNIPDGVRTTFARAGVDIGTLSRQSSTFEG